MSLDELIAEAQLGEEARNFKESNLGKVLLGMAEQEVRAAEEALGSVDPTDIKKIVDLQNHIKVGKWFGQWLAELVIRGQQAMEVFKQRSVE